MAWNHMQSIKEVARHIGYQCGLSSVLRGYRQRRGLHMDHLLRETAKQRFIRIYETGAWVHSDSQQARSGIGSELMSTESIRSRLPVLLQRLACKTMIDVGCGDWNWMQTVTTPCEYLGIDIVPSVIQDNRRFERPGVRFEVADAIADPLPECDLILCREMLFHLSFEDGLRALQNMRKSSKWLCLTTDTCIWFNSQIDTGDFRVINLQMPPYSLPKPLELIPDDAVITGRNIGLWTGDRNLGREE